MEEWNVIAMKNEESFTRFCPFWAQSGFQAETVCVKLYNISLAVWLFSTNTYRELA